MININSLNSNPYLNTESKNSAQKNRQSNNCAQNTSFGDNGVFYDYDYKPVHPLRKAFLSLANDAIGLVGFNAALWFIQDFVNGKILVNKINKHYTKDIHDNNQLAKLAGEMVESHKLHGLSFELGADGQAFYSDKVNKVVVGKDSFSSLFHEIGHAAIENKGSLMKHLQRFRGHYTAVSLILYTLLNQNRAKDDYNPNHDFATKAKNFLSKSTLLVPLLAFSPELITEFKASHHGIKFLQEKAKNGEIEKTLLSKIKKSYATCFATYLFIPVSIMLMEALQTGVRKELNKERRRNY